jgi:ComF family protein
VALDRCRWLARAADGLVGVLLAPACAACAAPLTFPTRGPVCDACWAGIAPFPPPLCDRCGDPLLSWRSADPEGAPILSRDADRDPLAEGRDADSTDRLDEGRDDSPHVPGARVCHRCAGRSAVISRTRAIGPYDGALRAILHAFKYDGCRSLARGLGARLTIAAADVLSTADVVVPVPLHHRRERRRGFNQARELAVELGLPVLDLLRRVRATPSQTGLPAAARRDNMKAAFALRRQMDAAGLRVVLVDDVSTTGATMEACAEVLRAGGAAGVSAATAARVASPPSG